MSVRNINNSKVAHYLASNNCSSLHPKNPLWDYSEGYKRPSEPLYSSSLILQSDFRQQQKAAYGCEGLRDIAIDMKSGLLSQIRKFKGIDLYSELISFRLQLLLPTQLLHFPSIPFSLMLMVQWSLVNFLCCHPEARFGTCSLLICIFCIIRYRGIHPNKRDRVPILWMHLFW
jgi:hypothetical protein